MITGEEFAKYFSDNNNEYGEELDNLLEKAFSEGYEYAQREFARRDYEGLSDEEIKILKERRSELARRLSGYRKATNKSFINQISDKAKEDWEKNPLNKDSWDSRKQVLLDRRNKSHGDDLNYFRNLAKEERKRIIDSRSKLNKIKEIVDIDSILESAKKHKKVLKRIGIGSVVVGGTVGTGLYLSNRAKKKKEKEK